ncbi:hypothetical protein [Spirosoma telluris]|uniref:hypothetical protein n=1 Tax=Spirosoma telluris TaxID=2183553 RepID=UPI002FC335B8
MHTSLTPRRVIPLRGSVTIFGPSTETANRFSTSVMVLGKVVGLRLIKKYPQYNYIMITDDGQILSTRNLDMKKYRL